MYKIYTVKEKNLITYWDLAHPIYLKTPSLISDTKNKIVKYFCVKSIKMWRHTLYTLYGQR